jgi:hypothetical protein
MKDTRTKWTARKANRRGTYEIQEKESYYEKPLVTDFIGFDTDSDRLYGGAESSSSNTDTNK